MSTPPGNGDGTKVTSIWEAVVEGESSPPGPNAAKVAALKRAATEGNVLKKEKQLQRREKQ